jgi:hypothetical protein
MFCPLCKTEYQEGFFTCADCSVPLVSELPEGEEPGGKTPRLAPIYRIVLNFYIDQFVMLLILLPILPRVTKWILKDETVNGYLFSAIGSLYWLLYYFCFEFYLMRTPAKYLTGTIIVSTDGKRPTVRQIVKRTLSRLIPLEPFSYKEGTWGHDRMSETEVVLNKHLHSDSAQPAAADGQAAAP